MYKLDPREEEKKGIYVQDFGKISSVLKVEDIFDESCNH